MIKKVMVGHKHAIGDERTFVVAEVGTNHGGSLNSALEAVDAAAESGADAVKFQCLDIKAMYLNPPENIRVLHTQIDTDERWFAHLKNRCDTHGVLFFATPAYLGAIDLLERIGTELYKLASAQVGVFPQLIKRVAATGKPVLLSTGLVSHDGLEQAVKRIRSENNNNYVILHCNSIYPTPPNLVRLDLMNLYRDIYGCPVGFSDHTVGSAVSLSAVAMGANVIEKHFLPHSEANTPDAEFSLNPEQFKKLVSDIRAVEAATRSCGLNTLETQALDFKKAVRYRLVLTRSKHVGQGFSKGDFDYKRNPNGIDCNLEELILEHMVAAKNLAPETLITWNLLKGR